MSFNPSIPSWPTLLLVGLFATWSCKPTSHKAGHDLSPKDTVLLLEVEIPAPKDTAGNAAPFRYENDLVKAQGVGLLRTNFYLVNYIYARPDAYYVDSIKLYDQTFEKQIGFVPVTNDGHGVSYDATLWLDGDTILYRRCDTDIQGGMNNWEGTSFVYAKSDGWMNILSCRYGLGTTWINMMDLDSTASYISWIDYFKEYPQGNTGWQHGYSWMGSLNAPVLPQAGNQDSIVTRVKGDLEIYPTGKFDGHWAEVVVKEVKYIFDQHGEYFEKAIYGKEWKGWLKVVSANGHPLLTEVILGC